MASRQQGTPFDIDESMDIATQDEDDTTSIHLASNSANPLLHV